MKWGLITLYMGPFGLLLYILADEEPRPGTHETFTSRTVFFSLSLDSIAGWRMLCSLESLGTGTGLARFQHVGQTTVTLIHSRFVFAHLSFIGSGGNFAQRGNRQRGWAKLRKALDMGLAYRRGRSRELARKLSRCGR